MVVIMIGRKRSSAARRTASCADKWPSARDHGEVDQHDPVLLDDADEQNMPISAIRLKSKWNSINVAIAPTPAEGKVEMIVIGWM